MQRTVPAKEHIHQTLFFLRLLPFTLLCLLNLIHLLLLDLLRHDYRFNLLLELLWFPLLGGRFDRGLLHLLWCGGYFLFRGSQLFGRRLVFL